MTQVPLAAITKLFVQVVVAVAIENGAVTVSAGLPRVMDTPVLLVTVILLAALATPTAVVGKVIVPGLSETLLVPVPVKPMSCGEEGSLSLITTDPRVAPVDFVPQVTPMVQLDPAFRLLPDAGQVLDARV